MKFGPRDFAKLRNSLLVLVLMSALGIAAVIYSRTMTTDAQQLFAREQSSRQEIDGKLRRVRNEENEIRQKAELFSQLQARGVIGEESRLDWVELLRAIRERHGLIEVHYELSPRHALDKTPVGALGLYVSTMKLSARLLHEEDLIRLLDDLRHGARALIQIRRCDVSRLPRTDNAQRGNLQAECVIDWITLSQATDQAKGSSP